MYLLAVIYLAFISLGLPDSLLGSAWSTMQKMFDVPISSVREIRKQSSLYKQRAHMWVRRSCLRYSVCRQLRFNKAASAVFAYIYNSYDMYDGKSIQKRKEGVKEARKH